MSLTQANSFSTTSKNVAVVTGASSGIGRAAVREFLAKGWHVVATMRSPDRETEFAGVTDITLARLDVTDAASINALVAKLEAELGRVDVLVNNAGYGLMGAFEETAPEQIERQFQTNVFGLMNVTRGVLPLMRRQGRGRIVNISSIGGRIGIPLYSSYHATKFAVEGFTESLNFELNPFGIDAVLIEPGAIATDFLGRSGDFVTPVAGSPYKAYFDRVMDAFQKASTKGSTPDVVARRIVAVAAKPKAALRNPVGGGAELLMALRKALPDRIVHGLVKQQTRG